MQKTVKVALFQFFIAVFALFFLNLADAGKPVWTFTSDPNYPTTLSISPVTTATVIYTVTNQSPKTHTLVMKPIPGITQIITADSCPNPVTLAYQQSCILSLSINGNQLTGNIKGGPVLCQQGGIFECYQPSAADILNITLIPVAKYLITPTAGENGSIAPGSPQTVVSGSSLTFTAASDLGYQVDQWLVDGNMAQKGGTTFTLTQINANHTVEATFAHLGTIYSGTASGSVYFSTNNGLTWTATTIPSIGYAVNSVFSTMSTLYVGSADGKVYYSTNNGVLWNATAAVPGATTINSVFATQAGNVVTIYSGTQDGNVYYTSDGTVWTPTTAPGAGAVNGLFITSANTLYAGSQDGNVYYSINNGSTWNQITGPEASASIPIHNIFATNNQLYVNTWRTTTNSTLPPGTIDFEYAYFTNSLTAQNPSWTLLSQITYALFVNSDASLIHAGTQDGHVFSLSTGDDLGFITYSPINSLFFLG